ncbi:hypothetical protein CDES_10110 [Corynebacterium deserti GIMN1.010]|uniref:DUF2786 domain-containing protein n=1 Tax=Corynebacterium deserti GIMN1.010 TaxID=931089 RepID=A0A0M4CEQ3_9CORY|nr:DUF2786 domain-containing protein [Corynebacterium deserti]ALC06404.1 hypothetical protein CDES_10110 [Corynebacterium deserti GIMN1.010]
MTASNHINSVYGARSQYRDHLVANIVESLGLCANRGWTPSDLRHEFSADIDFLLYRALSDVAFASSADMYSLWLRETDVNAEDMLSISSLEQIMHALPFLKSLSEWEILNALNEQVDAELPADYTPEQAKAHNRIIALLKKAESTTFEKEAEALIFKAETLRQQYRIESLLVDSYSSTPSSKPSVVASRAYLHAPWIRHQFKLLSSVARVHACESLLITKSGIATIFGAPDDVAHVIDLFGSLNRQRDHFMRTSPGAHESQLRGQTNAYRRSFMIAYARQITYLLIDAREETMEQLAEEAPSAYDAILPVLHERAAQSQSALKQFFPNSRNMSFESNNRRGILDGIDAANKSHLGGDSAGLLSRKSLNP